MNHGCSVSELQTVCFVYVADDSFEMLSVHNVRDSGVVSVEVLDSQLPKHCANKWGIVSFPALQSGQRSCTERFIFLR